MKGIFSRSIVLLGTVALAACSGDAGTRPISADTAASLQRTTTSGGPLVTVTPTPVPSPVAGTSVNMTATVYSYAGSPLPGASVTWTSSDTTIASFTPSGTLSATLNAKAAGTVTITVQCSTEKYATFSLTVKPIPVVPVKSVAVALVLSALHPSDTTRATATLKDSLGNVLTGRTVTWTSSAPSIATVSPAGQVIAVANGSASITASSAGVTGTAPVTVSTVVTTPPVMPPSTGFGTEVLAALPSVYMNTTAPAAPAAGGKVIPVAAGANLQTAINSALPGDVIELANGATFTGNFILPNKNTTSASYITIRPANWASLPAQGTRMTPALAASLQLPRIQAGNNNYAIVTAAGAHHYRIMGVEVTAASTLGQSYGIVGFDAGAAQTTIAAVPHDLILDRSWVHGYTAMALRRCVTLNSAMSAVVDSYLNECHDSGSDSQAIAGWNGPGPFKIVNNFLEGAGENVIFGGADPSIPNLTPSDIEIRHNYLSKQVSWKGGSWLIKNLLEIKHGQRVLIEGNILENSWANGQNGLAIGIKTVNQNGGCTWCVTQDVTVRMNLIRNVGSVFNIAASPDNNFPDIHARRITVMDNVVSNINVGAFNGDGRGFMLSGDLTNVVIAHNTLMSPTNGAFVFGPYGTHQTAFSARDNLVNGGAYGVFGDNLTWAASLNYYVPSSNFVANAIVSAQPGTLPAGNWFASSTSGVGFVNLAGEDFHLLSTSPYHNKATDGRDVGANVDWVNTATLNAR